MKLELNESGRNYVLALKSVLDHLSVGGQVKTKSGHTIVMTESGTPGFLCEFYNSETSESGEVIMQIDSETVWNFLTDYARKMNRQDIIKLRDDVSVNRGL